MVWFGEKTELNQTKLIEQLKKNWTELLICSEPNFHNSSANRLSILNRNEPT